MKRCAEPAFGHSHRRNPLRAPTYLFQLPRSLTGLPGGSAHRISTSKQSAESLSGTPWDKPLSDGLGKDSGNWRRKLRISEICVFILSTKWRREPHLELAIRSLVKRKITKFTRYGMEIIHHKEFETIPGRTTDGVSVSPLVARLCLQNAAPKGSPATCFGLPEACQRNKARVRSLWSTVRALFWDLFSTPSDQDLKPTPGVSVILTPVGLLVYQWQIDNSAANPQKSRVGNLY